MLLHDGFGPGPGLGLSRCSLLLSLTDMGSRRGKATLKLSQRYVWSLVVGCLETPAVTWTKCYVERDGRRGRRQ